MRQMSRGVIQLLAELAVLNDPSFNSVCRNRIKVVGSPAEEVVCRPMVNEPHGAVGAVWTAERNRVPEDLHVAEQDDPHGQQEDDVVLVDGGEEHQFRIVQPEGNTLWKMASGIEDRITGCPHGGGHQHTGAGACGRAGTRWDSPPTGSDGWS